MSAICEKQGEELTGPRDPVPEASVVPPAMSLSPKDQDTGGWMPAKRPEFLASVCLYVILEFCLLPLSVSLIPLESEKIFF